MKRASPEVPAEDAHPTTQRSQRRQKQKLTSPDHGKKPKSHQRKDQESKSIKMNERLAQVYEHMMMEKGLPSKDLKDMFPCVVKVFCVHSDPDYTMPWQMNKQYTSTSSGFLISGRRILTNAHSVDNFSQVKVRRRGSATKYIAQVLAIGRDCDMALLTVEDEAFWVDAPFIDVERLKTDQKRMLPNLEERVAVVGYPVGGENLSVTVGVVSRIDMQEYTMGDYDLLAVQVDAAINPGNSGGPVFDQDNDFVGIAFQALKDGTTENCGYIIPMPLVFHFLEDVERNKEYTGFCNLGLSLQKLEDKVIRDFMGLKHRKGGVIVGKIPPLSPAKGLVKEGDVLLEVDGIPIASDGTVEFPRHWTRGQSFLLSASADPVQQGVEPESMDQDDMGEDEWEDEEAVDEPVEESMGAFERIDLGFIVSQKFVGDTLKLGLLRNPATEQEQKEEKEREAARDKEAAYLPTEIPTSITYPPTLPIEKIVEIPLEGKIPLVPREGSRRKEGHPHLYLPSYFIVHGFCFVPLTEMYFVSEYGPAFDQEAPIELLYAWLYADRRYHNEQVVLLSHVLAHNVNTGYENLTNMRLIKINGKPVLNLKHCADMVQGVLQHAQTTQDARFLKMEFQGGATVVLSTQDILAYGDQVLKQHSVPRSQSQDLD